MSLEYRFHKFMKRIGAYSIPDEVIDRAEFYRSLPASHRRFLNAFNRDDLPFEESAKRAGLTLEEAQAVLDRVDEYLERTEGASEPEPDPEPAEAHSQAIS
jgi:hypothetical protein